MRKVHPNFILILILLILSVIFLGFEYTRDGDFRLYMDAARNLFIMPNLYYPMYGNSNEFFYLGNPFLTLLLYPLSFIPTQAGAMLWKLFSILLFWRIWKLIEFHFSEFLLNQRQRAIWLGLSFLCSFFLIYANLHLIQFTLFMLYLSLEGIYQIFYKKRQVLGAVLISLSIAVKISTVVLIPYLLWRKKLISSLTAVLICLSFLFLPSIFLGWEKNQLLWQEWWQTVNIDGEKQIFDMNNRKNHGISTLLSTLFLKDITDNIVSIESRRYLVDLGANTVRYLIYGARLFFVVFTLYFVGVSPFRKAKSKLKLFWELSYLFLVIPIIFPQQRIYNFIFLLPAIAYLIHDFLKDDHKKNKLKLAFFSLACLVLNLELILGQFRKYYWHYKTISYATLVILILLATTKPSKLYKR